MCPCYVIIVQFPLASRVSVSAIWSACWASGTSYTPSCTNRSWGMIRDGWSRSGICHYWFQPGGHFWNWNDRGPRIRSRGSPQSAWKWSVPFWLHRVSWPVWFFDLLGALECCLASCRRRKSRHESTEMSFESCIQCYKHPAKNLLHLIIAD